MLRSTRPDIDDSPRGPARRARAAATPTTVRVALSLGAAAILALSGCASDDEPVASASPSGTAPASASPTTPAPSDDADAEASPEPELADAGFALVPLPEGWTMEPSGDAEGEEQREWLVQDASGEPMMRLLSTDGQYAPDGVDPECTVTSTVLETRPIADAGSAGDDVVAAATIEERDGVDGTIWQLRMGVTVAELVEAPQCEVFYGVYPGATSIGIEVVPVPQEAFDFPAREDAEAYAQTDEYATLMDVLAGIRITL